MHHADVVRAGIIGGAECHLLPLNIDLPAVRLIHAKEHTHECALSGAVFAQQRIDFAALNLDADIVVGDNAWKALGNMAHFHNVVFHGPTPIGF